MSRHLELIAGEHTIDTSLLTCGGWVLDAGCRDFRFAREVVSRGCRVLALDADPTVEDPKIEGVAFMNVAIASEVGIRLFLMHENPEARHLLDRFDFRAGEKAIRVFADTIQNLSRDRLLDAVKLDVEGAEYDILLNWPGPLARQISVEFHEHCAPRPQCLYDDIFARLGRWYEVVQHEKTSRHCTHPNYWDSLFVLKGLL